MNSFNIATTPLLHFGNGKISVLPSAIKVFGTKILLVTGAHSFLSSVYGLALMSALVENGVVIEHASIGKEPTPSLIDSVVRMYSASVPDVVVAIGGGSVIDGGKAISAMLLLNEPVRDYLEGIGKKQHVGTKIPFIAVPTTSGTGSEATKNAVLSETGLAGFKRSLRHNNFVPNVAIVDPMLSVGCPPSVTASSGMDAFTQLLESYVSTTANHITDALAYEGLRQVSMSLLTAYHDGQIVEARSSMSLASYLSGITLANAGLGLVHGFASSIGGYFDIPHGIICSSLMASANAVTIRKLRSDEHHSEAIVKYATIGKQFSTTKDRSDDYYVDYLVELILNWTIEMKIPILTECGVSQGDYPKIVEATDNKNNPVALNPDEMMEVLELASNRATHV